MRTRVNEHETIRNFESSTARTIFLETPGTFSRSLCHFFGFSLLPANSLVLAEILIQGHAPMGDDIIWFLGQYTTR